jgi:uncharacterized protein (DUF427 family)
MKADWNGMTVAESDATVVVEGNHYFPPSSLAEGVFRESSTRTLCGWKGEASYYDLVVEGKTNRDAAWYYPSTKPAASEIEGYVAFWRGVTVAP